MKKLMAIYSKLLFKVHIASSYIFPKIVNKMDYDIMTSTTTSDWCRNTSRTLKQDKKSGLTRTPGHTENGIRCLEEV
jgi:hypothetical protein